MSLFNPKILSDEDFDFAHSFLGTERLHHPDLVIAPDGAPYLFRWQVIPRNEKANVYFHVQVASDPERPLHDHPWDNTSVILSGGYNETWDPQPWLQHERRFYGPKPASRALRKGDVVHRKAGEAHRLILPPQHRYAMSMFSTGPVTREWGFYFEVDGWRNSKDVLKSLADGRSVMREEYRDD